MSLWETIYSWFVGFYGQELYDYMAGFNCATNGYDNPAIFGQFIWIPLLSLALAAIYYYVIPTVRIANRWWWVAFLLVSFAVGLGITFGMVRGHEANIGICLMETESGIPLLGVVQYLRFALVNAFFSAVLFFVFSLIMKRGSRNCRYMPF